MPNNQQQVLIEWTLWHRQPPPPPPPRFWHPQIWDLLSSKFGWKMRQTEQFRTRHRQALLRAVTSHHSHPHTRVWPYIRKTIAFHISWWAFFVVVVVVVVHVQVYALQNEQANAVVRFETSPRCRAIPTSNTYFFDVTSSRSLHLLGHVCTHECGPVFGLNHILQYAC